MEFHMHLGLGNDLFKILGQALMAMGFKKTLDDWQRPFGVKKSEHYWGQHNRNHIIKILQNTERLRMLMRNGPGFQKMGPILNAMRALEGVKNPCFSQTFDDDY